MIRTPFLHKLPRRFVFVDERIRSLLDMKIFVDTDADIRIMRRVRRVRAMAVSSWSRK